MLCTVHKVATVLIISEDLGGHPATGSLSLWMTTELRTLEGLDDAHCGAGYSCQLGNAEQGHVIGVLSNRSSISFPTYLPTYIPTYIQTFKHSNIQHITHNRQHTYERIPRTRPLVVWILAHANTLHMRQCSVLMRLDVLNSFVCPLALMIVAGRSNRWDDSVLTHMFHKSFLEPRCIYCDSCFSDGTPTQTYARRQLC